MNIKIIQCLNFRSQAYAMAAVEQALRQQLFAQMHCTGRHRLGMAGQQGLHGHTQVLGSTAAHVRGTGVRTTVRMSTGGREPKKFGGVWGLPRGQTVA